MALNSMQEIFEKAASRSIPFWRVVLETDMEERQVTEEQSMEKMRAAWHAMLESAVSYQGDQRSRSVSSSPSAAIRSRSAARPSVRPAKSGAWPLAADCASLSAWSLKSVRLS